MSTRRFQSDAPHGEAPCVSDVSDVSDFLLNSFIFSSSARFATTIKGLERKRRVRGGSATSDTSDTCSLSGCGCTSTKPGLCLL